MAEPVYSTAVVDIANRAGMSRPLGDLVVKLGEPVQRRPRLFSWVMLTAGVVIIGGAAWVGYRSYEAYHHLQEASAQVAVLQSQLSDISAIDAAATAVTVDRLQAEASAARSAVEDPIYGAAVAVPLIGPNLGALRVIAETVESLSTDVLPPLAEAAQGLDPADWAPTDGTIDLEPIERLSPLLQQADGAVHRALEHIAAIDRGAVIQPVGDAVTALQSKLGKAAEATVAGARITRLLPPMLGSAAPRTYLVAFQNSAELRATGGIFGSYAVVRADHGKITIVDQGPARNLGRFDPPAVELPANQKALYGDRMARFPADVNFAPDFPTAARLYLEMYRLRTGTTVDGVVAIDPVALSYALKGAAPIDVGDGISIDADNVVSVLLSTAYQSFAGADQSARDAFLAHASAVVFGKMMSGAGESSALIDGLRKAVDERRLLVYSTDPAQQSDIGQTDVAGILRNDPSAPSIGVFFNDGTEAKLGYYLNSEVHVTDVGCVNDGSRRLEVRLTMHDNGPDGGLPDYVTGSVPAGEPYVLRTNVLVFAPVGGGIAGTAVRDGALISLRPGNDQEREVVTTTVALTPGTSTQLVFTVVAPALPAGLVNPVVPELVLTPAVTPWVTSVQPFAGCPAPAP